MNAEQKVADAFRVVALRLEEALERGRRSNAIDANDLLETLLTVADELDPPLANRVGPAEACPNCGGREVDRLVWQDDESVRCDACGKMYQPGK